MSVKDGNAAVEVWIADKQASISQTIKTGLRALGVHNFKEFDSAAGLRKYFSQMSPDLLIADADLSDDDVTGICRDIRHGKLGDNPFIPIIATSFQQDAPLLRGVIDSGVDGLLLKPVSIENLNRHIQAVSEDRKPFVVTTLYIGPDRRSDSSRANTARQFDVPNVWAQKRNGEFSGKDAAQEQIQKVLADINIERMRRGAFEISFLAVLISQAAAKSTAGRQTKGQLARCRVVLKEIRARSVGTPFEAQGERLTAFEAKISSVQSRFADENTLDINGFGQDASELLAVFFPEKNAEALAKDVAAAVDGFQKRLKAKSKAVA